MDLQEKGEAWAHDQHLKLTTMANEKVSQIDLAVDDHLAWFKQHSTVESLLSTRYNNKKRPRSATIMESDGESTSTKRTGRNEGAETDEEFFDAPDHESQQENTIPSPPAVRRSPRTRHREVAEQAPPATRRKQSHHDDTQNNPLRRSDSTTSMSPEIRPATALSNASDRGSTEPLISAIGTESYIAAVEAPVIEIPSTSPLTPNPKRPRSTASSSQIAKESELAQSKAVRTRSSSLVSSSTPVAAATERRQSRRSTDPKTSLHPEESQRRGNSMGSASSWSTRTSLLSAKTSLSRRTEDMVGMSSMVSIGSLDLPKLSAPQGIPIPTEKQDLGEEEDRVQLVRIGRSQQTPDSSSNQTVLIPDDYQPESEEQPDPVVDLTSVPAWAKDPDLAAQLERQSKVDADRIFGRIRTVNLDGKVYVWMHGFVLNLLYIVFLAIFPPHVEAPAEAPAEPSAE
ncbi:hypothetical protein BCR43DRAFT_487455 [Syncephalastrum racemosum]|uniref:Inner centromere protein ARK-binding domain-containing protein n=1 Tax=Syncephalastrum racemosum TaxID=13706 RepID=A0A1X2HQV2_SYNRA|nr:hypothetical protein BCR43DRAFT_487455 [Syncephalastrum racemosum]